MTQAGMFCYVELSSNNIYFYKRKVFPSLILKKLHGEFVLLQKTVCDGDIKKILGATKEV